MEEHNYSKKPNKEHPWIALLVQTILVTIFEWLGAIVGMAILWDYSETDFPIFELFAGSLVGLFIGAIIGALISGRFWIKSLRLTLVTLLSMVTGTTVSFSIWWVLAY